MLYIGNFLGFIAIVLFVLSYQLKKREQIIICNTLSRCFYVLQYIFLGAFAGAVLDFGATIISALIINKETSKKLKFTIVAILYVIMVTISLVIECNIMSFVALAGITCEVVSFFFTKEKYIRIVSLAGQPFWFTYNAYYMAISSVVGNFITVVSIISAIIRYDIANKKSVINAEEK